MGDLTIDVVNNLVDAIRKYDSQPFTLDYMKKAFPDVNFRYVIMPDRILPWAFNFDPKVISNEIDLGYKIATETIKNGLTFDQLEGRYMERRHIDHMKPRPVS